MNWATGRKLILLILATDPGKVRNVLLVIPGEIIMSEAEV